MFMADVMLFSFFLQNLWWIIGLANNNWSFNTKYIILVHKSFVVGVWQYHESLVNAMSIVYYIIGKYAEFQDKNYF